MKTTTAARTKIVTATAMAGVALLLAGCGGSSGNGAPDAKGGATSVSEPTGASESHEIEDGTYVAANLTENKNERAAVIVLDGASVTHTYSDCWYGVTTATGTRSGDEITWDDGGEYPGVMDVRISSDGDVGFDLTSSGAIAYLPDFFPKETPGLVDDLAAFNERCDYPIPEA